MNAQRMSPFHRLQGTEKSTTDLNDREGDSYERFTKYNVLE